LGPEPRIETAEYSQAIHHNGLRLSLHPAGHILGSSQIRIEHQGHVSVFTGDFKLDNDPTATPFELVRCQTLVAEATFGLPIYRWAPGRAFDELHAWWRSNMTTGKASLLLAYALGKAQRILAELPSAIGPIYTHGAVERLNEVYRAAGIRLPATCRVADAPTGTDWSGALIIAPPLALGTPWTRRFGRASVALASGWMQIRGTRRRRAVDRGFAISDHADWPGLLDTIRDSGAGQVWATHGYTAVLVRWLREQGLSAHGLPTRFQGEIEEGVADDHSLAEERV
jgi:putative mRNA 3-end processing factor